MKKIIVYIGCAFISLGVLAQNKTYLYKKIEDNPERVADKLISVYMPTSFSSQTISIGIGTDGIWAITNKVKATGSFGFLPIMLPKVVSGIDIEAGGTLNLIQKRKEKDIKVVLSWSDSQSQVGNTVYRETSAKWLNSSGTFLNQTLVRGGLYYRRTTFSGKTANSLDVEYPLSMTGIYGGFEFSTQAALISEVDGVKGITSGYTRLYLDALVLPLTRVNTIVNGLGVGGRVGFWTCFNPNRAKKAKPEKLVHYQAYQTMFFKAEVGYRPVEKLFFTLGIGVRVFANK